MSKELDELKGALDASQEETNKGVIIMDDYKFIKFQDSIQELYDEAKEEGFNEGFNKALSMAVSKLGTVEGDVIVFKGGYMDRSTLERLRVQLKELGVKAIIHLDDGQDLSKLSDINLSLLGLKRS